MKYTASTANTAPVKFVCGARVRMFALLLCLVMLAVPLAAGADGMGIGTEGAGSGTGDNDGAGDVGTGGTDTGGTSDIGTGNENGTGAGNTSSAPDIGIADIAPGVANASGLAYQDGIYRDMAEGYNDTIIVTVTVRDGRINELETANRSGAEANEYLQKATEGIREQLISSQSVEGLDAISGATGSSNSIFEALRGVALQATATDTIGGMGGAGNGISAGMSGGAASSSTGSGIGTAASGSPQAAATPRPTIDPDKAEVFSGLGSTANFRTGPGKDEEGTPVYSFNVTMANALFDKKGRILNARVDIYEVSTPNYDGDSMPHFSGWPGKEGYNVYDSAKGGLAGVSVNTEESAARELSEWRTKRERGDEYGMNPQNDWYEQMNAYEGWMTGKTVAELREWFNKYTTSAGRPIKLDSQNEDDIKVLQGLSDKERQGLADITSMATMSLSDAHGLILEALEKAYENRVPVEGVETD